MTRPRDQQEQRCGTGKRTKTLRPSVMQVLLFAVSCQSCLVEICMALEVNAHAVIALGAQTRGTQQTEKAPTKPKRRKFVRSGEFSAAKKPMLVEHKFQQPYADMVLAEDTGALLGFRKATVDFFSLESSSTGKPAKTMLMNGDITSACYKQVDGNGYFLVGHAATANLSVFSTESYELVREVAIPTSTSVLNIVTPPDAELPFVCVSVRRSDSKALAVVDLRTNGVVAWLPALQDLYPLGKRLYGDDLRVYSLTEDPQQLLKSEGTPARSTAKPTNPHWGDKKQPYAASLHVAGGERFAVRGSDVLSGDLKSHLGTLPVTPACCFRSRAIAVATSHRREKVVSQPAATSYRRGIQLFSLETSAPLGREVRLPNSEPTSGRAIEPGHRVIVDEQHMRVIYFDRHGIVFVPLDRFELQQPPDLVASYQGPERMSAATTNTFTVSSDRRLTVVPQRMPHGMKFDGKTFSWQPTLAQVGAHKVVVGVRYEGVRLATIERTFEFPMFVDYPSIALPFEAVDFHIHTDNRTLVIWGASDAGREIAVIDLSTGMVVAQNTAPVWLDSVRVAGDYVLVIPEPKTLGTVKILNRDLTPKTLISLPGSITSVQSNESVFIVETKSLARFYDVKTLEQTAAIPIAQKPNGTKSRRVFLTTNGIRIDNAFFDITGKAKLVQNTLSIPSVSPPTPTADPRITGRLPFRLRDRERAIARAREQERLLNDGRAVQVSLEEQPTSNRYQRRIRRAPLLKATVHNVDVRWTAAHATQYLSPGRSSYKLRVRNDTAYIASRKSLFRWKVPGKPFSNDTKSEIGDKLQLVLDGDNKQARLVLNTTDPTVLKHGGIGGTGPYQFAVAHSHPGFSIDPDTGTVTIEAKAMHLEAADKLAQYLQRRGRPKSMAETLSQMLPGLAREATARFGVSPTGVPVVVAVSVTVTDQTLESDSINYFMLLDLPTKMVEEAIARLEAQSGQTVHMKRPSRELRRLRGSIESLEATMLWARQKLAAEDGKPLPKAGKFYELGVGARIAALKKQAEKLLERISPVEEQPAVRP